MVHLQEVGYRKFRQAVPVEQLVQLLDENRESPHNYMVVTLGLCVKWPLPIHDKMELCKKWEPLGPVQ
jgi:hypothetical protein